MSDLGNPIRNALKLAALAPRSHFDDGGRIYPVRVYHGSPYDFDRFDMSKIGTGEGAQAFGKGLYFAERERIAKSYRDQLAKKAVTPELMAIKNRLVAADDHVSSVINEHGLATHEYQEAHAKFAAVNRELQAYLDTLKGHMYEVGLDADPDQFIDWDKPLGQQPNRVLDALHAAGVFKPYQAEAHPSGTGWTLDGGLAPWDKGRLSYASAASAQSAADSYNRNMFGAEAAPKNVSAMRQMFQAGIPGLRYLDRSSRYTGDPNGGSRNYVAFDDSIAHILRKYARGGDVENAPPDYVTPEKEAWDPKANAKASRDRAKGKVVIPQHDLWDLSQGHKVPDVPQFDLERNRPPRGVSARVQDLVNRKDVYQGVAEAIHAGLKSVGRGWYNTEPLLEDFRRVLGKGKGEDAYRHFFHMVAATSPQTKVPENIRLASYYYKRHMNGEPINPDQTFPAPYNSLGLHKMNADRLVKGGKLDPVNNPKIASFIENLTGNQKPVTVDTHAFRLPGLISGDDRFMVRGYQPEPKGEKYNIQKMVREGELPTHAAQSYGPLWQGAPDPGNEYGAMEQYYKHLADDFGISPAQAQASAWVGGARQTNMESDPNKTFMRLLQDKIHETAHHYGVDPRTVLDDFIRHKVALRNRGGTVR